MPSGRRYPLNNRRDSQGLAARASGPVEPSGLTFEQAGGAGTTDKLLIGLVYRDVDNDDPIDVGELHAEPVAARVHGFNTVTTTQANVLALTAFIFGTDGGGLSETLRDVAGNIHHAASGWDLVTDQDAEKVNANTNVAVYTTEDTTASVAPVPSPPGLWSGGQYETGNGFSGASNAYELILFLSPDAATVPNLIGSPVVETSSGAVTSIAFSSNAFIDEGAETGDLLLAIAVGYDEAWTAAPPDGWTDILLVANGGKLEGSFESPEDYESFGSWVFGDGITLRVCYAIMG